MAGGISQALITTATGMIIAIPCLLVYNWLKSRVEAYILEMEEVAIQMVDKLVQKQ
ncbi:MAG: MotA/TolQ/ExbB proton channel family protein [Fibrobacterota bacterium]